MPVRRFGPFQGDQGPFTVDIQSDAFQTWHEITFSVVDGVGTPIASPVGTIAGAGKANGADKFEAFSGTIDLTTDSRSFTPFSSATAEFQFTFTGMPATQFINVTVTSWSQ